MGSKQYIEEVVLRKFIRELIFSENPFPRFRKYNRELAKELEREKTELKRSQITFHRNIPKSNKTINNEAKSTKSFDKHEMRPSQFSRTVAGPEDLIPGLIKPVIVRESANGSQSNISGSIKPRIIEFSDMINKRGTIKSEIPYISSNPGNPDLGKLNYLINDRFVDFLECRGPNKKILVRKNGKKLSTSLILTDEEINFIINYFSNLTRIPLIQGRIKAAYGNLIIDAYAPGDIGNRFIIQKKH